MILDADIDRTNPATPIVKLSGRMTLGMRLREVESRIDEAIDGGAQADPRSLRRRLLPTAPASA